MIFLGANFDRVGNVARGLGVVDTGKFINSNAKNLKGTMRDFSTYSTAYASTGKAVNFSDEDKTKAVS